MLTRAFPSLTVSILLTFVFASATSTVAADIKVLGSNAIAEVMADLTPAFEKATGHKLSSIYEATNGIMARIKAGETADVVILIKGSVDELKTSGKVVADSSIDIANTVLGVAVRKGAPKPDISTPEALKAAMLGTKSLARSEIGASGLHFARVLEKLGIADAMKAKTIVVTGAARTADLVAKGEAETAVQMMSELLPVAGVDVVGPLPGDLGFQIVLTGAAMSGGKDTAAAVALLQFLRSDAAAATYRARGMQRL
jgi:molybdate transport system substrate-binding protein